MKFEDKDSVFFREIDDEDKMERRGWGIIVLGMLLLWIVVSLTLYLFK